MFCEFIECNIAENVWCECKHCGRKLEGFINAVDLNRLNIHCQQIQKMKIYYARPISLYNTKQEERDLQLLRQLGFEVINPNKEEFQKRYATEGMDVFLNAIGACQALAFRSFVDGKISQGVWKEIKKAQEQGKPVLELPTLTLNRELSVEETRNYLTMSGYR